MNSDEFQRIARNSYDSQVIPPDSEALLGLGGGGAGREGAQCCGRQGMHASACTKVALSFPLGARQLLAPQPHSRRQRTMATSSLLAVCNNSFPRFWNLFFQGVCCCQRGTFLDERCCGHQVALAQHGSETMIFIRSTRKLGPRRTSYASSLLPSAS